MQLLGQFKTGDRLGYAGCCGQRRSEPTGSACNPSETSQIPRHANPATGCGYSLGFEEEALMALGVESRRGLAPRGTRQTVWSAEVGFRPLCHVPGLWPEDGLADVPRNPAALVGSSALQIHLLRMRAPHTAGSQSSGYEPERKEQLGCYDPTCK